MYVDITKAAQFYKIQRVPSVMYGPEISEGFSVFDYNSWTIYYGDFPKVVDGLSMDQYFSRRFAKAGAIVHSHADIVRLALAHELWHTRQAETDIGRVRREFRKMEAGFRREDEACSLGIGPLWGFIYPR